MTRLFLLFLLLLVTSPAHTQNYQCVQSGVRRYFTNDDNYLRGIRIDSVRTYPDSIVYFPFHTRRGPYPGSLGSTPFPVDSAGGHWLGKRITQLNDGTFWFENIWADTVIIKTQVSVGDSWVFYSDTTSIYYTATVTSKDVLPLLGTTDSVISLQITANGPSGPIASDPANSLTIAISKNFGFFEVFDLYLFPLRHLGSVPVRLVDYFYSKSNTHQFRATELYNARSDEIYDFNIGDVYKYHGRRDYYGPDTWYYCLDTIVGKTIITSSQFAYTVRRHESFHQTFDHYWLYNSATLTTTINVAPIMDTGIMPEEIGVDRLVYYNHSDTSFCETGHSYKFLIGPLYIDGLSCLSTNSYKTGLGSTYWDICSTDTYRWDATALDYCKKNSVECGVFTPLPNGVDKTADVNRKFSLFPNPADQIVSIVPPSTTTSDLRIVDQLGRTVLSTKCEGTLYKIDISNMQQGLYTAVITNSEGNREALQLTIVH